MEAFHGVMSMAIFNCSTCSKTHSVHILPYEYPVEIKGELYTHYFLCPNTDIVVSVRQVEKTE